VENRLKVAITLLKVARAFTFSGPNSATLHYGHAGAPNNRTMRDGDMWWVRLHYMYTIHSHQQCATITVSCYLTID
jgi:hypothetical protein